MYGFLPLRVRLWSEDAFWLIPLVGLAAAWLLDGVSLFIDEALFDAGTRRVVSADAASTLLVAIGGGMITFTGFVFSVVLLVLQYGSSAYSPRAVSYFLRTRSTQWILALFLATITFSFLSLPEVGSLGRAGFVPLGSVVIAALLLGASLFGFLVLLHLVGKRIRVDEVLTNLGRLSRRGLRRRVTLTERPNVLRLEGIETPDDGRTVHYQGPPGQIVGLSVRRLARLAARSGSDVVLQSRVGDAISTGAPFAKVIGGDIADTALSRCLLVRHERSLRYDPLYALRILTDISLRALSPAINDPTTATRSLDEVEGVLRTAAPLQLGPVAITGEGWRVEVPLSTWSDVVDLALLEVVDAAIGQPQVTRRLVALLNDLQSDLPERRHGPLERYQRRLVQGVHERLPPEYHDIALTGDRQGIGGSR